ncbi:hypothetical protein [Acinetobacter haemolyticus]|uniref:Uncharacterized protein n=1 Tax=Acinetobacter haemolyticus CIP 64.3 = MTCC 9819 TaxID=1217659 RepID=N9FG24_ACIHA|nr:hypothetical protein [Acinetobacter haemolyticus]ENW21487.1 hypothetical protein F927_00301 [Acinetobacter haemolyticus CIP 64.3 = MTCC 9819]QXZ27465.1 hypothetical protein I6L22_04030 [Acinetobacter haemolyticus]SPT48880.1 Uncharacterised protein [Acinetobacter haemolyticus]SUU66894.1 Uncharacterised protein [Acinetobacter haemolyticus]
MLSKQKIILPLLCTVFLTACGGGGSGNSNNSTGKPETKPETKVEYITLKGNARAYGNVLDNIRLNVTAKCVNGTGFKTDVVR